MVLASIQLMMRPTRESGLMVRRKVREKSPSKVAAFLRVISKMTLSMDMGRCTTIHRVTTSKESGKMT